MELVSVDCEKPIVRMRYFIAGLRQSGRSVAERGQCEGSVWTASVKLVPTTIVTSPANGLAFVQRILTKLSARQRPLQSS
jgi:hypothetical protein